jgi:hypothetical protein
MPVQIPKINRFEPQQSQSIGRSDIQAPNIAAITQPQTNAVLNLADQQLNYFQKQEDNAIDTAAKAAAVEYNIYLNGELTKANQIKGDPTKTYTQFDESSTEGFDAILNKNPDLSSRGKSAVVKALYEVKQDYKLKRDTAYHTKYYDYDLDLTKASTKLDGQEILTIASYVDPVNPTSFESLKPKIDAKIAKIAQTWKTHGGKFGQNITDEYGNEVPNDVVKVEVAKSISDSLIPTIDYLNRSGHPEIAEQIYGEYSRYIDSYKKDTVKKSIADQQQLIKALNVVPSLMGKSPEQVESILNKEFKNDPIGKDKAYQALSSRINKKENIESNIAKDAYSRGYNRLSSIMASKTPYKSFFDIENDPVIGPQLPNMTPTQVSALKKMVNTPAESNIQARNSFYNAFQKGELKGMSPETLNEMQAGLNKADRGRTQALWEKYNSPQTSAEEIRQMNFMSSKLIPQLQTAGYIRKVERFVDYSNTTQQKITEAQTELMEELQRLPPMSVDKQMDYMRGFAARKAKGEAFKQPEYDEIKNGASLSGVKTLKEQVSRADAIKALFKQLKKTPSSEQINEYMKKANGG